jgi:exosortase
MIAVGCVMSVLGQNALTRFFPAVLALAFLVPVPGELRQQIAVQLQQATATITQAILGAFGVETRVIGNTLSINGKELIVAEACNGMRLVFPLVMITFVFAFSIPLRNSVRFVLLLASPLVALVCNVIRTVPTVWIHGQFTDPAAKFPEQFHDAAGWAMLPLAFVVLMALIRVLRWAQVPVQRYTLANQ